MTHGRVVTEHDVHAGRLVSGRRTIPTCIAVEAGQADLFLSGYLGIDFITRGLAVYRLLDAVVTFHRGLAGAGRNDPVRHPHRAFLPPGGNPPVPFPLRRDGQRRAAAHHARRLCRFLHRAELDAGKGIVRPRHRPPPDNGQAAGRLAGTGADVPGELQRRPARPPPRGDLAGCFGPLFADLPCAEPA